MYVIEDFFGWCLNKKRVQEEQDYQKKRWLELTSWKKTRGYPLSTNNFEEDYKLMMIHNERAQKIKQGLEDRRNRLLAVLNGIKIRKQSERLFIKLGSLVLGQTLG